MKDAKVLVTGATGFVGGHLVELLRNNYKLVGISRTADTLKCTSNVTYEKLDLKDRQSVGRFIRTHTPDFIIHLAAETHKWFDSPHALLTTNLAGTINLYESILQEKVRAGYSPKIIYVSSSEAYGKTTVPEKIDERAPLLPVNHYGASKACADIMSHNYASSQGLNIVIARPFTHTGPAQRTGFFVPDMASQIALAEKQENYILKVGNLGAVRDYLDVRDVVRAYALLLEAGTRPGDVYNICSGKGIQVSKLLDIMISKSNVRIDVEQDPRRVRLTDAPKLVGNNERIKSVTHWQPLIDMQQTLEDTLNFWRVRIQGNGN